MNTDSYFEIGHGHIVCEDYAISEKIGDLTFVIVSDGCSQSKNTDVGARLTSIIARDTLIYLYKSSFFDLFKNNLEKEDNIPMIFQELFLEKCLETKAILNLSTDTFDATLLISFAINNKLFTLCYGDGNIVYCTKDSSVIIDSIEYKSGAPYYLSYQLNQDKKKEYLKEFGHYPIIVSSSSSEDDVQVYSRDFKDVKSYWKIMDLKDDVLSSVTITSDGLGTYFKDKKWRTDEDLYHELPLSNIIDRITAYKNLKGQFVVRRMSRIKREMTEDHFYHDDDISCATISLL